MHSLNILELADALDAEKCCVEILYGQPSNTTQRELGMKQTSPVSASPPLTPPRETVLARPPHHQVAARSAAWQKPKRHLCYDGTTDGLIRFVADLDRLIDSQQIPRHDEQELAQLLCSTPYHIVKKAKQICYYKTTHCNNGFEVAQNCSYGRNCMHLHKGDIPRVKTNDPSILYFVILTLVTQPARVRSKR